ncbi:hypothetical protein [Nocardioides convexus]|uniref:hypothetical protein n=1 Tax=Nocardioides convexus TaxID=2712224 RepID=UPI002418799A|nr:hypothetical protein [Nocardioides convexus]
MTHRILTLALLAGLLTAGVATASPASATPRITVVNDRGTAAADLRYRTRLTVTGRGFQTVKGGFGGVYLMFGWVDDPRGGSWKPSRGGVTGADYRYIPDAESAAANQGYLKFIAFPGRLDRRRGERRAVGVGRLLGLPSPCPARRSRASTATARSSPSTAARSPAA